MNNILLYIRKKFYSNNSRFILIVFSILLPCIVLGMVTDSFLPFTLWWNVIRTIILIPLASSFFCLWYILSIKNADNRRSQDPDWKTLKEKLSPSWRYRLTAVIASFLVVMSYVTSKTIMYTLVTSLITASIFALIVFVSKTKDEQYNETHGIPDERDVNISRRLLQEERKREEALLLKEEEKRKRKEEKLNKKEKFKKNLF